MLCRNCRCQIAGGDDVCTVCGTPVKGRAPLELVIADGRRIPLVYGPLTLGRGSENLIRIQGETVSRNHARIVIDPDGPAVEDAGSTYGTFVDGRHITGRTLLRDGSKLGLGDVQLTVESKRHESESGRTVVFGAIPGLPDEDGAALRYPRLRVGSKLKRLSADEGDLRFVLRGPDGRFVRLSAADADLLELLNGENSLSSLIIAATGRFGADGPSKLASMLADLGERGLLEGVEEAKPPPSKKKLARIFRMRQWDFTWLGPIFTKVYRAGGFLLFTKPPLIVFALISSAGIVAFADLIGSGTVAPFVVAGKVGVGGIVFLVGRFLVVIVHEFAHGLTVESFGRKVPKAGIKLMLIFPYAYVDTSEAWFEPARRRIAISAAGPISDLTIAGGAALLAVFSSPGTLQDVWFQLALAAYTGAIFNLNPLLDRDGYHILVDLMREPGLRRRSREWLSNRLSGREAEPDDAGVLATYAITALVWSLATAAFTVVMSQRYYGYMTAIAPASLVWTVLIAFYILMLLPILAVFWKAYSARRSDRETGVEGAVV
jgi:putative peptide zinc metalloprotease protein